MGVRVQWHFLKSNCSVDLGLWGYPPGVAKQHKAFFNECLPACPVDYDTNYVPNPPFYTDYGTA